MKTYMRIGTPLVRAKNSRVRSQPHQRLLAGISIGLALVVFTYWWWIWQVPMLRPDDYMFASRSNEPQGAFLMSDVVSEAWRYVMHVNGRLSDAITQMLVSSMPVVAVFLSLIHVWSALGIFLWLTRLTGAVRIGGHVVNAVMAFALPFILLAFDPSMAGDVYHFIAGTVSTIGGFACAIWTLWFVVKAVESRQGSFYYWAALSTFALTGMFHELSAFFLLPALSFLAVFGLPGCGEKPSRRFFYPLMMLVVARLMTPGLWRRVDVVNDHVYGDASSLGRYERIFVGVTGLFSSVIPLVWVFLAVVMVAVFLVDTCRGVQRGKLWTMGAAYALILVAWWLLGARLNGITRERLSRGITEITDVTWSMSGIVFMGLAGVLSLALVALFVRYGRQPGAGEVILLVLGAAVTAAIPLSLGNSAGRQMFFFDATLLCSIAAMTSDSLKGRVSQKPLVSKSVAAVAVIVSSVSVLTYSLIYLEAREDYQGFLREVEAVRRGQNAVIDLTREVRHPEIYGPSQMDRDDVPANLILYWDLPQDTVVLLP